MQKKIAWSLLTKSVSGYSRCSGSSHPQGPPGRPLLMGPRWCFLTLLNLKIKCPALFHAIGMKIDRPQIDETCRVCSLARIDLPCFYRCHLVWPLHAGDRMSISTSAGEILCNCFGVLSCVNTTTVPNVVPNTTQIA